VVGGGTGRLAPVPLLIARYRILAVLARVGWFYKESWGAGPDGLRRFRYKLNAPDGLRRFRYKVNAPDGLRRFRYKVNAPDGLRRFRYRTACAGSATAKRLIVQRGAR
jgi:hypothetical protein